MILGAVLLIVALATTDAAPSRGEYDLDDCRTQKMAKNTHHAENPQDCRTFYNCDNAHGGKLTYCSAGTIYDPDSGVCTKQGECKDWYEKANCLFNPGGTGKFPGHCCNSYYEYSCAARGFVGAKCPENQYFMFNGQNDGSCGPTRPSPSDCAMCDDKRPTTCDSLGLEYVGPCQFKHKDDDNIMDCAAGTKMDQLSCKCVLDISNVCPLKLPVNQIKEGCGSLNVETFGIDRTDGCQPVNTLSGRDLVFTPFALKMSFTLSRSSIGGDIPILKTDASDMKCEGLQLDVSIANGNTVKVTVGDRSGVQVALEGNIGGFGSPGGNIELKIVFDVWGKQFLGTVNNNRLTDPLGGNSGTLNNWANSGLSTLCLPCLDNVSGRTEFSVWRRCTDLSQLN